MAEWFRSWHGAPVDQKWFAVAARAGVPVYAVSAVAWALFDHASQASARGDVSNFDCESYSLLSGLEEDKVRAIYVALQAKGVIVNGRLAHWDKRQPSSTERVKDHRARRKGDGGPDSRGEDGSAAEPASAQVRDIEDCGPPDEPAPAAPAASSAALVSPQAIALADEIAVAVGHELPHVPPEWCGAAARVQVWFGQGWRLDVIRSSVREQMMRRRAKGHGPPDRVNYFEKGIAAAHAQLDAPLPTVVPFSPEIIRAKQNGKTQGSLISAGQRLIASLEGAGGAVCDDADRLLPQGRG